MNDRNRDARAHEDTPATPPPSCSRAAELVTYLYGEATVQESSDFKRHLSACDSCREEFAAFGDVRAGIGEWRREALSLAPALAFNDATPAASTVASKPTSRGRSAVAALREFFALSPLWLQAGGVAAMLSVCALAALTLARTEIRWDEKGLAFQTGVSGRVVERRVEVVSKVAPSEKELEALVNERVRLELESIKRQADENASLNAVARTGIEMPAPRRAGAAQAEASLRDTPRADKSKRAVSTRQQLARNRLDERDEENLPRLFDLLNEVN